MKAVQIVKPNDLRIIDMDKPTIDVKNNVLVKIKAAVLQDHASRGEHCQPENQMMQRTLLRGCTYGKTLRTSNARPYMRTIACGILCLQSPAGCATIAISHLAC